MPPSSLGCVLSKADSRLGQLRAVCLFCLAYSALVKAIGWKQNQTNRSGLKAHQQARQITLVLAVLGVFPIAPLQSSVARPKVLGSKTCQCDNPLQKARQNTVLALGDSNSEAAKTGHVAFSLFECRCKCLVDYSSS